MKLYPKVFPRVTFEISSYILNDFNFRTVMMVGAHIIFVLPVFTSLVVYAQDAEMEDYDTEVVSEWSSGEYLSDLNQQCKTDCDRVCLAECPIPKLCKEDEIECGVWHLPPGVWPGCTKDKICIPKHCECKKRYFLMKNFTTIFEILKISNYLKFNDFTF